MKKKEVSLGNIVLKLIIVNIDKITLVVMYVLSIYTVNISHLILVIIFMIQLLRPSAIEKICYFVLVLIQLIFSAEYILDIVKVFLGDKLKEETFINIIKFVCDFDLKTASLRENKKNYFTFEFYVKQKNNIIQLKDIILMMMKLHLI